MTRVAIFFVLLFVLASCRHKHVCHNTDPVFEQYSFDDPQYKLEVIRLLKKEDPLKLRYYIEKYIERAKKPFMIVSVQGDSLCAKIILDIKNENKLKEYKNVKGLTYNGSEILHLQYTIDSGFGSYNFIFEEGEIEK